jgi:hypothetical protein
MSILNRAKSHFESLGVQSIEIEEWADDEGKASVIYWSPITLSEKKKLFDKSSNINDVGLLADIIIMKAIDKDGKKLFSLEDKLTLMHKVDSEIVAKVATAMVQSITPDEVKKK